MAGVATVIVAWNAGRIRLVNPPRVLITGFTRGLVFGAPGDANGQRRTLETALAMIERDAPLAPEYLETGA